MASGEGWTRRVQQAKNRSKVVGGEAIASSDEALKNEASKVSVDLWLRDVLTNPGKHIASMVASAALYGTNSVTNIHRFAKSSKLRNDVTTFLGAATNFVTSLSPGNVNSAIAAEINAVIDEMKNPNIEGIPIHAEVEKEIRDVDVSNNLYIIESSYNKEYLTDNTVPKLKQWQIQGYLTHNPYLSGITSQLIIKPDLVIQKKMLDWYMDSRRPVLFKTHDNQFYTVLITHCDTQYTIQGLNAVAINMTLQEYKVLQVETSPMNLTIAEAGAVK